MSNLRVVSIGEVIDVKTGFPFKSAQYTSNDDDIKLLRGDNIIQGELRWENVKRWSKLEYDQFAEYQLIDGDVVLAMDRPWIEAGLKFAQISSHHLPCLLVQRTSRLRAISGEIDQDYIKYILSTRVFSGYIQNVSTGTAVPHISKRQIESFTFSLPNIEEQREISRKLKTLDDKIALNRRTNETLEAMAQALFKSWFVDFDPVIDNALDAGHALPDALATRVEQRKAVRASGEYAPLAADIRALFPASFVWSEELGKFVPRGWGVKRLNDVTHINPKEKLPKNTVAPYIGMKQLPESGYSIDDYELKPYAGGAKFKQGDVLVARITPCLENGKTGVVDFLEPDVVGFGSTEFIVLRAKDNTPMSWVANLARNSQFKRHLVRSMVGSSGRQRVQPDAVTGYLLPLPDDDSEVWTKFAELTQKSFALFSSNHAESATLSTLRDVLLGELIG